VLARVVDAKGGFIGPSPGLPRGGGFAERWDGVRPRSLRATAPRNSHCTATACAFPVAANDRRSAAGARLPARSAGWRRMTVGCNGVLGNTVLLEDALLLGDDLEMIEMMKIVACQQGEDPLDRDVSELGWGIEYGVGRT